LGKGKSPLKIASLIPLPAFVSNMEPTKGSYDIDSVETIDVLRDEIKHMYKSDNSAKVLSDLLMNGHKGVGGYLSFGNNKISKNTGILI